MIKKYTQYIKEYLNQDIDPYGEEDWEIDNLSPVLQIARRYGKPYDQILDIYCAFHELTNLEGIENLRNLAMLHCSYNQLTDLKGIEKFDSP